MPSQKILRSVLDYDPETGILRWKVQTARGITVGDIAGCREAGCWRVRLFKKNWGAHRLIWKWMYDAEPECVDHINNNWYDNRIVNLRAATNTENRWNSRVFQTRKFRSSLKGACKGKRGRWFSTIKRNGTTHWLGTFASAEEAHAAYVAKAQKLHAEFANAGYR